MYKKYKSSQSNIEVRIMKNIFKDIKNNSIDCIVFAGDVTCDGNIDIYRSFIKLMQGLNIPFLFIPGNSDLRNPEYKDDIALWVRTQDKLVDADIGVVRFI